MSAQSVVSDAYDQTNARLNTTTVGGTAQLVTTYHDIDEVFRLVASNLTVRVISVG